MGYQGDSYLYSISTLEQIANCYDTIYDGLELCVRHGLYHRLEIRLESLAEYKGDFDMAWKKLPPPLRHSISKYIQGDMDYNTRQALRMMRDILNGETN